MSIDIRVYKGPTLPPMAVKELVETLDLWLEEFSDPKEEILEAVYNALAGGFIVLAYYKDKLEGIAIVSKVNFETFFPRYHLSYIATRPEFRGKGIGTALLTKIKEITGGDISLHVELANHRAIRLYEKMGFKKKYYRMLYREGNSK
ncbi:GNAT family N-acetyltransferase [Thermococcus sp.]